MNERINWIQKVYTDRGLVREIPKSNYVGDTYHESMRCYHCLNKITVHNLFTENGWVLKHISKHKCI